jgi:hypothetical protein
MAPIIGSARWSAQPHMLRPGSRDAGQRHGLALASAEDFGSATQWTNVSHSGQIETTVGGATVAREIAQAARTDDVLVGFCGLASPEQHTATAADAVATSPGCPAHP